MSQVSRKRKDLYYLFPGSRGGARKKFVRQVIAALIVACITCGLFVWICFLFAN